MLASMGLVFGVLTGIAVFVLLVAEWRKNGVLRWIAKPIAALGFIFAAIAQGATDSDYGRAVLGALVLSFAGDVLLIPKNTFKAGVIAFLLAHVAYVFAFFQRELSLVHAGLAAIVLVPIAIFIARTILPGVSKELRGPVLAYMAVISTMVAFAIATRNPTIIAAAICFYFSDLCVARERFMKSGFVNKLFGLPLYFGAQLIFAATIHSP